MLNLQEFFSLRHLQISQEIQSLLGRIDIWQLTCNIITQISFPSETMLDTVHCTVQTAVPQSQQPPAAEIIRSLKSMDSVNSGISWLNQTASIWLPLKKGFRSGCSADSEPHASSSCNFQASASRRCLNPQTLKQCNAHFPLKDRSILGLFH